MENRTSVATNGYSHPRPTRRGKPCVPSKAVAADELTRADRAAIASGAAPLPYAVDGRGKLAKRYRSIAGQLVADAGADNLAEARLQLIARFAGCCVLAEQVEARLISGQQVDLSDFATLVSSLCRLASKIGLDRIPRNVTSSNLRDYLDTRQTIDADDGGAE